MHPGICTLKYAFSSSITANGNSSTCSPMGKETLLGGQAKVVFWLDELSWKEWNWHPKTRKATWRRLFNTALHLSQKKKLFLVCFLLHHWTLKSKYLNPTNKKLSLQIKKQQLSTAHCVFMSSKPNYPASSSKQSAQAVPPPTYGYRRSIEATYRFYFKASSSRRDMKVHLLHVRQK